MPWINKPMNEKKSFTEYAVSSPTANFPIGFDFSEDVNNLHVTLNGFDLSTTGHTFELVNKSTITVTPAIAAGALRITRETDIDDSKYNFTAGAIFEARTMDENFAQVRESQQEVRDRQSYVEGRVLPLANGLEDALAQADAASKAAQAAADAAEEAASTTKSHTTLTDREVADAHPATAISTTLGITQQAVNDLLYKRTSAQVINVSNFGSTGTVTSGSTSGWVNALAFAKSIAPVITNNIGQSWFDLSNFKFISDNVLYLNSQLTLRSTYGAQLHFSIALADNFVSTTGFAIDTSIRTSEDNSLNRRPLSTSFYGNINCRYKGNGIYLHDFLHFVLYGNVYNWVAKGVETGTSGNEFIQMPQSTVGQWQYTANGVADLPAGITSGTAIDVNCGDCVILGIVSYYVTRGIRVNGRSCYVGSGAHIYGDRKQALMQTASGGNLLLDGVWFDASRVELVAEAIMRNCRVYLSSGDSTIGVIINGGTEVTVEGNTFSGISSGTTAIYRDAAALANKSCFVGKNTYWDGVSNSDVRTLAPAIRGDANVGTAVYTKQTGAYERVGNSLNFTMHVAWSSTDATGNLLVTGLPFVATYDTVFPVMSVTGPLTPIVAYVLAGTSQLRFRNASSVTQVAASGDLYISGQYLIN